MNCRGCGERIPDFLLKRDSFVCPNCGKAYRRKPQESVAVRKKTNMAKNPTVQHPFLWKAKNILKKRVWKFPLWAYLAVILLALMVGSDGSEKPATDITVPPEIAVSTVNDLTAETVIIQDSASPVPTDIPEVTESPIIVATNAPEPTQSYISNENVIPTNDIEQATEPEQMEIRPGDTGSNVKALQSRLITLGFLSGSADGQFGSKTETAVEEYQREAGLPVTGVCDYDTYLSMVSDNAPRRETQKTKTESTAKEEKVWIAPYSGEKYHEKNCRTLKNARSVEALTVSQAKNAGYTACKVCDP